MGITRSHIEYDIRKKLTLFFKKNRRISSVCWGSSSIRYGNDEYGNMTCLRLNKKFCVDEIELFGGLSEIYQVGIKNRVNNENFRVRVYQQLDDFLEKVFKPWFPNTISFNDGLSYKDLIVLIDYVNVMIDNYLEIGGDKWTFSGIETIDKNKERSYEFYYLKYRILPIFLKQLENPKFCEKNRITNKDEFADFMLNFCVGKTKDLLLNSEIFLAFQELLSYLFILSDKYYDEFNYNSEGPHNERIEVRFPGVDANEEEININW